MWPFSLSIENQNRFSKLVWQEKKNVLLKSNVSWTLIVSHTQEVTDIGSHIIYVIPGPANLINLANKIPKEQKSRKVLIYSILKTVLFMRFYEIKRTIIIICTVYNI